jgi:hypothetical protein
MQLVFIIVAATGLAYFLCAKRRFDFFTLAHISACVYFLPGFVGFVRDGPRKDVQVDILPEAYHVMIAVMAAIMLAGWLYDQTASEPKQSTEPRSNLMAAYIALAIALVGAALSVHTSGPALFSPDKSELTETLTRWVVLWMFGASFAAVVAFQQRQWRTLAVAFALLVFSVYVGFRASCALTVIAMFMLHLADGDRQRFALARLRTVTLGLGFAAFFFVYKFLYQLVKSGQFDRVSERIGDPDLYVTSILSSEPFGIQSILNEIVRTDFQTGMGYIARGLLAQFALFGSDLNISTVDFNSLYQPKLFPDATFGTGDNIWAQMIAAGGWPRLAAFLVFFVAVLAIGSRWLAASNQCTRAAVALGFTYWAFYIHRNDIAYELTLLRRVFFIWAVCVVASSVISRLASSDPNRAPARMKDRPRTSLSRSH